MVGLNGTVEVTSAAPAGPLPLAFYWVAVPAYVVWGLGLGAGALAFDRATRPWRQAGGRLEGGP